MQMCVCVVYIHTHQQGTRDFRKRKQPAHCCCSTGTKSHHHHMHKPRPPANQGREAVTCGPTMDSNFPPSWAGQQKMLHARQLPRAVLHARDSRAFVKMTAVMMLVLNMGQLINGYSAGACGCGEGARGIRETGLPAGASCR